MTAVTYARLRATDPARWRAAALAWRRWASLAGPWSADFGIQLGRIRDAWSGPAASAAAGRLLRLRQDTDAFRLLCWEVDQTLSEFAAALTRARVLLDRAVAAAARAGLVIGDDGTVRLPGPGTHGGTVRVAAPASADPGAATREFGARSERAPVQESGRVAAALAAVDGVVADLTAALRVAAEADAAAAARLAGATLPAPPPASAAPLPPSDATPAQIRRWWDGLTPDRRRRLTVTRAGWIGSLDGLPAGARDAANRLRLDEQAAVAGSGERAGLDRLADRLADDAGPRAYLMGLDTSGDGRAVVALGDPDRAANVLTHVPGMTADLASYGGELARAGRVAERAAQRAPAASTSTVMWLGYDAPDFVHEAAGAGQAQAGAAGLRRFQEGLRAAHHGPGRLTVLGHSYGSLVVGTAAATPGLEADGVVFVGSPGVGVDSAARLHVPDGRVWSSTSQSDVIQHLPVAPGGLLRDLALSAALPVAGPLHAFGRPEDELWYGRNPSDPEFGARVFASQPDGGHLGYWDRGRPALDAITDITLGRTDVTPR